MRGVIRRSRGKNSEAAVTSLLKTLFLNQGSCLAAAVSRKVVATIYLFHYWCNIAALL